MAEPSARLFLLVRAPNGDSREVHLGSTPIVVGRDDSADIRVEDKKVSRRHAAFKMIDGEPWVEDLGSQNGVKLNGKRVQKRARLTLKDKVKVGGYEIRLREVEVGADEASALSETSPPLDKSNEPTDDGVFSGNPKPPLVDDSGYAENAPVLEALDPPVQGRRFVLQRGENIIGRLEDCAVPVLDPSVSRQHVRVVFARDRLSLSDLGSSNGTFVNEVRVEMAELADGDLLRVGNIRFRVKIPELGEVTGESDIVDGPERGKRNIIRMVWAAAFIVLGVAGGAAYWKISRAQRSQDAVAIATKPTDAGALAIAPDAGAAAEVERTIEPITAEDLAGKRAAVPADAGRQEVPVEPAKPKEARAQIAAEAKTVEPAGAPDAEPSEDPVEAEAPTTGVAAADPKNAPSTTWTPSVAYGPRTGDGAIMELPAVDESFDFDAFVAEKLAAAKAAQAIGDLVQVKSSATELLGRDPINAEGRRLLAEATSRTDAEEAMARAETLIARSEWAKALKIYAAIPEGSFHGAAARAKLRELQPKGVGIELDLAEQEQKDKRTWARAHRRYRDVLELDPSSDRARAGVRAVERKMRAKGIRFEAYLTATSSTSAQGEDRPRVGGESATLDPAITSFHGGDETLARIAALYAEGAMKKAVQRAEAAEKKLEGAKREAARGLRQRLENVAGLAERVRNESANDPNAAWSRLLELERTEATILPKSVKSVVRKDLEESLAEAFALSGASLHDRGLFDEAFERWNSALKLDPNNPRVLAGLAKLEKRARQLFDEAELAAQRGERDVCSRWRSISRITRGDSDVHKRALERARQVCR